MSVGRLARPREYGSCPGSSGPGARGWTCLGDVAWPDWPTACPTPTPARWRTPPARRCDDRGMTLVFIAVGGAAGAVSRYLIEGLGRGPGRRPFPVGHVRGQHLGLVPAGRRLRPGHGPGHRVAGDPGAGDDRLHRLLHHLLDADAGVVAPGGGGRLPVHVRQPHRLGRGRHGRRRGRAGLGRLLP